MTADVTSADEGLSRPGVVGAVLTGGASRRMGRDKALVEVDGVAMARRVADVLDARSCRPVIAVGGDPQGLSAVGLTVIDDRWPGEGPLGGILTALQWARTGGLEPASPTGAGEHSLPCVLVAATDLPWLDGATIDALLAHRGRTDVDVVVARSDRLEPLCALWWPSAATVLGARFGAGERAVHGAMASLRTVEVDVGPGALVNVNAPSDLP